jgi:hypothetical protein
MAIKLANTLVMDAAFDYIDQSDVLRVCSVLTGTPTHAQVVTATLASVAIVPDTDFTKAAGDVSGRKVTVAAKAGVSVTATGTAEQIVLTKTSDTSVRYVTTCTSQALTSGNTCNIPAWKVEIAAAT